MLDALKTALEGEGWMPAEEGKRHQVLGFDITSVGYDATDDGIFPEYNLTIYDTFSKFEIERNESLDAAVQTALPHIYPLVGHYDVSAEIEDRIAVLSFVNLKERQ